VVFVAGASAVGLDYLNIHDRISEVTPGTARSTSTVPML
jgi:hypothetical protein